MAAKAGTLGYKLYISNLPWTVGSKQLKDYFSQFGHISRAIVIFDKSTGMSKGYGFITFTNEKSLNTVTKTPNHLLEGHNLNINPIDKSE